MAIEMNEPQVWTLIGVFAATLFAVLTLLSTMFVRTVTSGFDSVRREMAARFDGLHGEMNARFERVDDRIARVESRLECVETRLDHLDRDVQAISRRVFPEPD